jgi:hypothetical protein
MAVTDNRNSQHSIGIPSHHHITGVPNKVGRNQEKIPIQQLDPTTIRLDLSVTSGASFDTA